MNVLLILVNMATAQMVSLVTLVNVRMDILEIIAVLVCAYCYCYPHCVVCNEYTMLIKHHFLIQMFHYEFFSLLRTIKICEATVFLLRREKNFY